MTFSNDIKIHIGVWKMSKPCVGIVVQARLGSTRLPKKVLLDLTNGKCVLEYLLERLDTCHSADKVIVATTENLNDDFLVGLLKKGGHSFFRGSEPDCLDRFYNTAKKYGLNIIVRITSDCPLIIPEVIDDMIEYYLRNTKHLDYLSNRQFTNYPEGLDAEIFSMHMLEEAAMYADAPDEREHINYYFLRRDNKYRIRYYNHNYGYDYSRFKLSIDTINDYKRIFSFFNEKGLPENFNLPELITVLTDEEKHHV
jgi:spore coat polysaccharide biosynthesis protein SpsF